MPILRVKQADGTWKEIPAIGGGTGGGEKQYELIASTTTEEEVVEIQFGGYGEESLNLSDIVLLAYIPAASTNGSVSLFVFDKYDGRIAGTTMSSSTITTRENYIKAKLLSNAFGYELLYRANTDDNLRDKHDIHSQSNDKIATVKLTTAGFDVPFPAGTKVDLWGVRA